MYKRPHHYRGRVQANNKSSNTAVVSKMTIATLKAVNYPQVFQIVPLSRSRGLAVWPWPCLRLTLGCQYLALADCSQLTRLSLYLTGLGQLRRVCVESRKRKGGKKVKYCMRANDILSVVVGADVNVWYLHITGKQRQHRYC